MSEINGNLKKALNDPRIGELVGEVGEALGETARRFEEAAVRNTVVFFGSAQIKHYEEEGREQKERYEREFNGVNGRHSDESWDRLRRVGGIGYMGKYYEAAEELAYRISGWSKGREERKEGESYYVCSGGGPGIMEAANRGAHRAGYKSVGLGIDIPLEQEKNKYVTPQLKFLFNHFFLRKFWFFYFARAIVIFPGGIGTLDELFEVLNLIKVKKFDARVPIVLYGSEYWRRVIDFEPMVQYGTIEARDLDLVEYVDTVEDAYKYIVRALEALERERR